MKEYLLDVNILVAWGWQDHVEHERVDRWLSGFASAPLAQAGEAAPAAMILTSPITELGFVRVSMMRLRGQVPVAQTRQVLAGLIGRLGRAHRFLADDSPAAHLPRWVSDAAETTDGHLMALAVSHGAQLATCDTGIPGAFLLPR